MIVFLCEGGVKRMSHPEKTVELEYTVENVFFNVNTVDALRVVMPRKLRWGQVLSIYKALLRGEHFDVPMVVNKHHGAGTKVLDGQHRIEAMKLYFGKYPNHRIQITLITYLNLTLEEEREVYRKWNIAIKQSTDDFLHSFMDEMPVIQQIKKGVPCTVYGSNKKMKLRTLINAYHASKDEEYTGGERKTGYEFIKYMKSLTDEDAAEMQRVFGIIYDVFNSDKQEDFCRRSAFKNLVFRALYSLVAKNMDTLGEKYIKKQMKKTLCNRQILDEYRRYYGRRASVDAYLAFKGLLNRNADKLFV